MHKINEQISTISVGVIWIVLFFSNTLGQISDKEILDKHIDWNMLNPNIYQACSILAAKGIPIGIEDISGFSTLRYDEVVHIKTGSLKEILDSIVKQVPDFSWTINDGVINIYPINAKDEILGKLLDTKLQKFSSKKEGGRTQIASAIYSSKEIQNFLNVQQTDLGIATWFELEPNAINDINTSEINLRELLNKIIKESNDSKRWLIRRTKNGGVFLAF